MYITLLPEEYATSIIGILPDWYIPLLPEEYATFIIGIPPD